ncbi:hypothetical protein ATANTOWER_030042 [Ataeniobius toweri]|uniref:Uncharacterized protein n=1 Tax=Ataeniobius toweri TaxID=208326 RepID=A0ABU7AM72_9TELE|nr:hypothetical protein [Ataeniobius toweri]
MDTTAELFDCCKTPYEYCYVKPGSKVTHFRHFCCAMPVNQGLLLSELKNVVIFMSYFNGNGTMSQTECEVSTQSPTISSTILGSYPGEHPGRNNRGIVGFYISSIFLWG